MASSTFKFRKPVSRVFTYVDSWASRAHGSVIPSLPCNGRSDLDVDCECWWPPSLTDAVIVGRAAWVSAGRHCFAFGEGAVFGHVVTNEDCRADKAGGGDENSTTDHVGDTRTVSGDMVDARCAVSDLSSWLGLGSTMGVSHSVVRWRNRDGNVVDRQLFRLVVRSLPGPWGPRALLKKRETRQYASLYALPRRCQSRLLANEGRGVTSRAGLCCSLCVAP